MCAASHRSDDEFRHRISQAWAAFNKHKKVILNKHVSLARRLRYFDSCVTPAIQFGLCTLPMTKHKLDQLDILQRKMLRRIIGWRRVEDEPWRDTMKRMNQRMEHAEQLYTCKVWSNVFAEAQWRYVSHIIHGPISMWSRILCKFNWSTKDDPHAMFAPYRYSGHPHLRWDDHIHAFCQQKWRSGKNVHWFDILKWQSMKDLEQEYVDFLVN